MEQPLRVRKPGAEVGFRLPADGGEAHPIRNQKSGIRVELPGGDGRLLLRTPMSDRR
jgi:hypothetical protein